jgi:hypothetical protein
MIEDYIIIDDFITKSYQDGIEHNSKRLKWSYIDRTYTGESGQAVFIDQNVIDSPQMVSLLYGEPNDNTINFSYINPLLHTVEDTIGSKISSMIRVKYNLLLQNPKFNKSNYNVPHLDMFGEHLTALYYVNDSDGDTILFNEKYNEGGKPDKLTIRARIAPKKGRMLIFKSDIWHASSNPILSKDRIVINTIFKP